MSKLSATFFSIDQLYHAYRKAKFDVFFERSQPTSLAFCEYEQNLHSNLLELRKQLTKSKPTWFQDSPFIGGFGYIPKGLQWPHAPVEEDTLAHFSVSNPDDAWTMRVKSIGSDKPTAAFRPVALFTVDMYVICALWVNMIGHKFDACLGPSARGSRLRRLRKDPDEPRSHSNYHLQAQGSFKPYYYCYKEWRSKGLKAIRHELSEGRKVVAITMDLTSFYHNIDPRFVLRPEFLEKIRFARINGGAMTAEEETFTQQITEAFVTWSRSVQSGESESQPPGIPVGPSAPRIIANVLLAEFDKLAHEKLDPIYYSRYVDDIFLVLRDNGRFRNAKSVLKHLAKRIRPLKANDDMSMLKLEFPYAENCKLEFQAKKQRIFLLSGEVGADRLDAIENKIDEVSSEWRLLPDLDALERSPAAKVLTANRNSHEDADTLRKADGLSLKRLSFSIMLRHHDILAHDLPPEEWKKERFRFYRFAERHVLTPLRLLDLNDYLPRLMGLTVCCMDWEVAGRHLTRIKSAVRKLRKKVQVEPAEITEAQWSGYIRHLQFALRESVMRAFPFNRSAATKAAVSQLLEQIDGLNTPLPPLPDDLETFAGKLFWTDLSRIPFKYSILGYDHCPECPLKPWSGDLAPEQRARVAELKEFIADSEFTGTRLRPLIFPTRPFSVTEITQIDRRSVTDLARLKRFVTALRGSWVKPAMTVNHGDAVRQTDSTVAPVMAIGARAWKSSPKVAVTSFLVDDISWAKAAEGIPDLSVSRYKRLVRLSNAIVKCPQRPNYVVFPELAIPRKWILGFAGLFTKYGISVITGVEYRRYPAVDSNSVLNEAYLFLADDRLGYRSWAAIRQRKGVPAHHERNDLRSKFGLEFSLPSDAELTKPIYNHFGHNFGVLLCSELTDIKFRQQMRGNVDTLFVLSWNQDLESFGSLVEAAVLDVHCFTVLVNNRKFGDSRVRAPFKKPWKRDQIRVKGGLDDYFVVTDLNIGSLRDFQSHHEPPMGDDAEFKPTPEGFQVSKNRKQTPGDDT